MTIATEDREKWEASRISPNTRTLYYLRHHGYTAEVVEHRIPKTVITQDLFGFADVLAVHPDSVGALFIQATDGDNAGARMSKVAESEAAKICIRAGNQVEVWSWRDYVKFNPKGWRARVFKAVLDEGVITFQAAQ